MPNLKNVNYASNLQHLITLCLKNLDNVSSNACQAIEVEFATKRIKMHIDYPKSDIVVISENEYDINIKDSESYIILTPEHNIINKFGGTITKIRFHIGTVFKRDSPFPLLREINSKCPVLAKLEIIFNGGGNCFDTFAHPFGNVTELTFIGSFELLHNTKHQFSVIFPELKTLVLDGNFEAKDPTWAEQHFNQLEEFEAGRPQDNNSIKTLLKFIRNNYGIKRLKVDDGCAFLSVINEALPDLEHLELSIKIQRRKNSSTHRTNNSVQEIKSIHHLLSLTDGANEHQI